MVPILVIHRRWLIMMAIHPVTGERLYFIDKCLPFGASISCAVFQEFSDALRHLVEYLLKLNDILTNYLDDFLFVAISCDECDNMVRTFLVLCRRINCPIADEKTEWGTVLITFLGTLLDGERHCLCIPEEKRTKALNMLKTIRSKKKITIREVQCLTGLLNFLNRAIVPGRAFTRRMYAKLKVTDRHGRKLKQYHHVNIGSEFKKDAQVWQFFLENAYATELCRPFLDMNMEQTSEILNFYTDASGKLGYGCFFDGKWMFGKWDPDFLRDEEPSIEFLELFALCAAVLTWENFIQNTRIVIFCDNQAVVQMVNKTTSSCQNCMHLIRLLVLNNLRFNRRITVKYVKSAENILADSLSRFRFDIFWDHAPENTESTPWKIVEDLWPIQKYWIRN